MDKLLHLIVGCSLLIGSAAMGLHGPVRYLPVLGAAVGKEVYDQRHGGTDMREHGADIVATMLGAAIGGFVLRTPPVPPRVALVPACDSTSFVQWVQRRAAADRAGVQRAMGRCP